MDELNENEQPVSDDSRNELLKFVTEGKPKDEAIAEALSLILSFGQIDGDHHKTWAIDQVVRKLAGEKYQDFVDFYEVGDIEGMDLSDPAAVAKAHQIGSGDYYSDDFTQEEIQRVEAGYYSWDDGIAP